MATAQEQDVLDDVRAAQVIEQEGQTVVLYFKDRVEAEAAFDAFSRIHGI